MKFQIVFSRQKFNYLHNDQDFNLYVYIVCLFIFFALESTPRSSLEPTGGNWPFEHAFSRPRVCRVPVRWPTTDRHFMHDGNVRIDRKIYA